MSNEKIERLTRRMKLRNMAFQEAAALVKDRASRIDLDPSLSPEDEAAVREWLHIEIPKLLRVHGGALK